MECDNLCKTVQKFILFMFSCWDKAIPKHFVCTGWPGWHSTSHVQSSGWTRPPWVLDQSAAGCTGISSSLYKYGGGNYYDFLLLFLFFSTCTFTHFSFSLCWTEELSVWHESIRSFPLPGGREDRMPAVTKSQVYPTSGLHCPAARSHGSGN